MFYSSLLFPSYFCLFYMLSFFSITDSISNMFFFRLIHCISFRIYPSTALLTFIFLLFYLSLNLSLYFSICCLILLIPFFTFLFTTASPFTFLCISCSSQSPQQLSALHFPSYNISLLIPSFPTFPFYPLLNFSLN